MVQKNVSEQEVQSFADWAAPESASLCRRSLGGVKDFRRIVAELARAHFRWTVGVRLDSPATRRKGARPGDGLNCALRFDMDFASQRRSMFGGFRIATST